MGLKTLENEPVINTKPVTILRNFRRSANAPVQVKAFPENSICNELIEEVGHDVYDFLDRYGLMYDPHIIYLSSTRHYLYGLDELKHTNEVLNFRVLNSVSRVWYFLLTMNHILPLNGYFAGCFLDYKRQKQSVLKAKPSIFGFAMFYVYTFLNRIVPKIPVLNKVQLLFNNGKIKCLTRDEAQKLLEKNGFSLLAMTEIDGLTFFVAQKYSHVKERTFSLLTLWNNYKNKLRIKNN